MAGTSGASLNWGGLDRAIERAARRLADRKRLMATVGEALVSGATQRFVDEEDPQGKKWTPSQRAEREGGKTLNDTARLLRSLDYAATSDNVMVGAGSNVKYASIHHFGGQARRGQKTTIPARPYTGVSKADMEEVRAILSDFLADALRGK